MDKLDTSFLPREPLMRCFIDLIREFLKHRSVVFGIVACDMTNLYAVQDIKREIVLISIMYELCPLCQPAL